MVEKNSIARLVIPAAFTIIVFIGTDLTERFSENFSASIITADGIFLGFTLVVLTYSELIAKRFDNVKGDIFDTQIGKEVVKEWKDFLRELTLKTWLNHVLPFTFSLVSALGAITHTGFISNSYAIVAFLLMAYGIVNLIFSIQELYPKN